MPNFVRKSLFRHVFGQPYKREKQFESIPISRASTDNNMCAVNPKFVAIVTEASGGGSFLVLPLEQFGRVDINAPRVCGHKSTVLDIAWCPHNDNLIASCSEDSTIKVWYIPDGGVKEPITEAEQTLLGHQKKVMSIEWNPAAENILLSFAQDEPLFIWDVGTGEVLMKVEHPSAVVCASWSPIGDLIGTSCKDKKFRIVDARSGEIKQEGNGFEGAKPQKIKILKNNRAFAVGMSRQGRRQYKLFNTTDMSKPLEEEEVDNGSNTFNIFYDEDLSLIYLAAKGDCKLLYYEVDDEEPYVHYLALYQPKEASKGLGWMPKRGLNLNEHEVARFYRLKDRGGCEPCSMIVPRKSELFQADVYPPCVSLEPAMTADEWVVGANKPRPTVDMEQFFKGTGTVAPKAMRSSRLGRSAVPASGAASNKEEAAKPAPASSALSRRTETASGASNEQKKQIEDLIKEVEKLKATVKEQDERLAALEAQEGEINGN